LLHLGDFMAQSSGPLVLALALLGVAILAWRRLGLAVLLVGVLAFNLASQVLFAFDPTNPDVGGYFLLSVGIVAVLAIVTLEAAWAWAARASRVTRWVARTGLMVLPALAAVGLYGDARQRCTLSDFRDPEVFAEAVWRPVPSGGVLVTSYFETIFNLWYRDVAECRRPDAVLIHRLFRTYPGYDQFLLARYPDIAPALAVDRRGGQLDGNWLLGVAARDGVVLEADPTGDVALLGHLLPAGLVLRLSPSPVPAAAFPDWLLETQAQFWRWLYRNLHWQQRETAGNLLWAHYNLSRVWGAQGQTEAARAEWDRAWTLAPGDPMLLEARPVE
jgi:hypothetical protein